MSGLSTARQRGRIAELCRDNRDSRQLRALVLAEIRQVIDFDAYAWLLTDPQTRVGSAPWPASQTLRSYRSSSALSTPPPSIDGQR